ETLVHFDLHGVAAVLVPRGADRKLPCYLVFDLDNLPRGIRQIRGKGKKQVLGDALLDGKAPGAAALSAADLGIDGQRGNTRKFFHPAADLAGQLTGNDRLRRGGAGAGRFRRLTPGDKIDDIDRRQGRIRGVGHTHPIDGTGEVQADLELVDGG